MLQSAIQLCRLESPVADAIFLFHGQAHHPAQVQQVNLAVPVVSAYVSRNGEFFLHLGIHNVCLAWAHHREQHRPYLDH
jgi:hypothetical protein